MSRFDKKLQEGERLFKVIRQHPVTYFFQFFLALALIAAAFSFFFYFASLEISTRIAVSGVFLLSGLFYGARKLVAWRYTCLMATDRRLIIFKQKGFFGRKVSEIAYEKMEDISYQTKGILQAFFRYGTIIVRTGSSSVMKLTKVANPNKIQETIVFLRSKLRSQNGEESPEEEPEKDLLTAEEAFSRLPSQEVFKLIRMARNEFGNERIEKILSGD